MSAWSEVRRLARLRHAELAPSTDDLVPATVLLDAAEALTGVRRCPRPPGDALLDGAEASYDRERLRIYYSREIEPALVLVAKRCMARATRPVHPVWWLAPSPAPLSPWKYS